MDAASHQQEPSNFTLWIKLNFNKLDFDGWKVIIRKASDPI